MAHDDNAQVTYPAITPVLFYDDPTTMIEWLQSAFGFELLLKVEGKPGDVVYCELGHAGARMQINPASGNETYASPKTLGQVTGAVYLIVPDADAHCAAAREAGAEITLKPVNQDYGHRVYEARDPEGHVWWFAELLN